MIVFTKQGSRHLQVFLTEWFCVVSCYTGSFHSRDHKLANFVLAKWSFAVPNVVFWLLPLIYGQEKD